MVVLDEYGFYQSAESYKSELDEMYRTKPSGKITVLNVPPAGSFFYCLFREAKGKKSPEQWLTEYPQDISSEFPD